MDNPDVKVETLNKKIGEVAFYSWSFFLYYILLDFLVAFLLGALIAQFIGISLVLPVIFAVVFAFFRLIQKRKAVDIISKLAGKYENLDERLETAIEYKGTRNVIVEDLLGDVSKRMDMVETSTFLDYPLMRKRVVTLVVLCFLLLAVSVLNLRTAAFNALDFAINSVNMGDTLNKVMNGETGTVFDTLTGNRWEESNWSNDKDKNKVGAQSGGNRPGISEGPLPGSGSGTGGEGPKDIYGTASSASIQGKDVDFKLHPEYGGDIEIHETGGTPQANKFNLEDVSSVEECVDCVVGPEHEEMVRRYFEKILPES